MLSELRFKPVASRSRVQSVDQWAAALLWRVTRWSTARTGHAECITERPDTQNTSRCENIKHQEPFSENRFSPEIIL